MLFCTCVNTNIVYLSICIHQSEGTDTHECTYNHTYMHMQNTNMVYIYAQNIHICTRTTMCMQNGDSPLYIASQKGHYRIVETLLQTGARVDLQDKVKNYYCRTGFN